jgi:hypothetical protein
MDFTSLPLLSSLMGFLTRRDVVCVSVTCHRVSGLWAWACDLCGRGRPACNTTQIASVLWSWLRPTRSMARLAAAMPTQALSFRHLPFSPPPHSTFFFLPPVFVPRPVCMSDVLWATRDCQVQEVRLPSRTATSQCGAVVATRHCASCTRGVVFLPPARPLQVCNPPFYIPQSVVQTTGDTVVIPDEGCVRRFDARRVVVLSKCVIMRPAALVVRSRRPSNPPPPTPRPSSCHFRPCCF